MLAFFFFLLDCGWSFRLYFAALADCTAASGFEVLKGRGVWARRKEGEAAVRAARRRFVGEVRERHEGQYIGDAIAVVRRGGSNGMVAIAVVLVLRLRRRTGVLNGQVCRVSYEHSNSHHPHPLAPQERSQGLIFDFTSTNQYAYRSVTMPKARVLPTCHEEEAGLLRAI